MKLVQYLSGFRAEYGGPVESVVHLCDALAEMGHEIVVVSRDLADVPSRWLDTNASGPIALLLPAGSGLTRLVAGVDLVHVHSFWDRGALRLARTARQLAVPYVLSPRGSLDKWPLAQSATKKRVFLATVGRAFVSGSAAMHFTADEERSQASEAVTVADSFVIPNPLNLSEFAPAAHHARPPTVLFFSRVHPKKGVEYLVDAMQLIQPRVRDVRLVIAGPGDDGYIAQIKQRCEDARIGELVEFRGPVYGQERAQLYAAADVLALPTSSENFGRVLFESLACGTPVVTTRHADAWPMLEASGGALLVEQDPADLADAIASVLLDRARRQHMGDSGREWVRANLDAGVVASRYALMYKELQAR